MGSRKRDALREPEADEETEEAAFEDAAEIEEDEEEQTPTLRAMRRDVPCPLVSGYDPALRLRTHQERYDEWRRFRAHEKARLSGRKLPDR